MSEVSILVQTIFATGICNVESKRFCNAPLDKRTEGWTEAWGDPKGGSTGNEKDWDQDKEDISQLLSTKYPQLPLVLTQYRPAWFEQLVLLMSDTPFIVLNSNYYSTEATGPLPYLTDIPTKSLQPPILVGRNNPSRAATSSEKVQKWDNSILDYLVSTKGIDLDKHITEPSDQITSKCFITMITTELKTILMYLRYEDRHAWEQVYRGQCIMASCGVNKPSWISKLGGRFQAWAERVMTRKYLVNTNSTTGFKCSSKEQAIAQAKECYSVLEKQLILAQSNDKDSLTLTLLGKSKPSLVDAYLWDHLANALCDINLVVVLSAFPHLVRYFQSVHETYFANPTSEQKQDEWKIWNRKQNISNPFQQLPNEPKRGLSFSSSSSSSDNEEHQQQRQFKDAMELMQSLSVHQHDLQEVLEVTKQIRSNDPIIPRSLGKESLLYRWRMGENLEQQPDDYETQQNPQRERLLREHIRDDQAWISGVAVVSFLAMMFIRDAASKK